MNDLPKLKYKNYTCMLVKINNNLNFLVNLKKDFFLDTITHFWQLYDYFFFLFLIKFYLFITSSMENNM